MAGALRGPRPLRGPLAGAESGTSPVSVTMSNVTPTPRRHALTPRRPWRTATLVASAFLSLLVSLLGGMGIAQAHSQLESTSPAAGATADTVPLEVVLTFNENVLRGLSRVGVADASGASVVAGEPTSEGRVVSQPLAPDLSAGTYTVTYKVTSADGHPISDRFTFLIAEGAAGVGTASTTSASVTPAGTASSTSNPSTSNPSTSDLSTVDAGETITPVTIPIAGGPTQGIGGRTIVFASLAAAVAVLAGAGLFLARRRRRP